MRWLPSTRPTARRPPRRARRRQYQHRHSRCADHRARDAGRVAVRIAGRCDATGRGCSAAAPTSGSDASAVAGRCRAASAAESLRLADAALSDADALRHYRTAAEQGSADGAFNSNWRLVQMRSADPEATNDYYYPRQSDFAVC